MKISTIKLSDLIKRTGYVVIAFVIANLVIIYVNSRYNKKIENINNDLNRLTDIAYKIEMYSEYSAEYAALYVHSAERTYYDKYVKNANIKSAMLNELSINNSATTSFFKDEDQAVLYAVNLANFIIEEEIAAFEAAENNDFEKARELLQSIYYKSYIAEFEYSMDNYKTSLQEHMLNLSAHERRSLFIAQITIFTIDLALACYGLYLLVIAGKRIDMLTKLARSSSEISSTSLKTLISSMREDEFNQLYQIVLSINMLLEELDFMSKQHLWGENEYFIDENRFSGSLKAAIKSINSNMKDNADMIFTLVDILTQIGEGVFQIAIPSYPGKKSILSISAENLLNTLKDISNAINNQVGSMITGRLSDRTDTSKFKGDFALLLDGLNSVVDAVAAPINETISVLAELSKGNFNVKMTGDYNGDFALIKNSLNTTIESINDYLSEIHMLVSIIMSADTGIIVKNLDGTVRNWNKGASRILGFSQDEMKGKEILIANYEKEQRLAYYEFTTVTQGEHIQFTDRQCIHKNGHVVHISGSHSPFYDTDGNVSGTFTFFEDITIQLEIENELKKAQEDIVSIMRVIPAPICAIGIKNAEILECNSAFVAMCGLNDISDIVGCKISKFVDLSLELQDKPDKALSLLESMKNNISVPLSVIGSNGIKIETEAFSRQFVFNDQDALAVYCVDLTKQREHEQALREAASAAHEANKTKSLFLANMSHEIRTPMNGIIGLSELALADKSISFKTLDYLSKIRNCANGLIYIINDILDLSKIEAGEIVLEKIPFDLHSIIVECEIISLPKAEEKGLYLYFYQEPKIPRKLIGDPTKLRQVLINFLSNAIKFTSRGLVSLTVKADPIPADDCKVSVTFEIKDSGIGMTKEQAAMVFEPFKQADSSTTRKYGGTGLGLSITKNIIELMGGEIFIESIPSVGSKFSFTVEFGLSDEEIMQNEAQSVPFIDIKQPMLNGHVLLCEDNKTNQQVAIEHLEKIGFEIDLAENGKICVDLVKDMLAKEKQYDLIFMDIHMPVMDGLEATKILVEMNISTPIIAMTANAMTHDKEKYLKAGMADYISKPFKSQVLWSCILRHLTPCENTDANNLPVNHFESSRYKKFDFFINQDKSVINWELGVERSADSEKLYIKILSDFLTEQPKTPSQLEKAILCHDFKTACRIAHTAKNIAETIGALKLSKTLLKLEIALSANIPVLDEKMINAYKAELIKVLNHISALNLPVVKCTPDTGNKSFDKSKALELIEILRPLLIAGLSESQDYTDQIRKTISTGGVFFESLSEIEEKCNKLISQIESYDFELSLETIDEIKRIINA